MLSSFPPHSAQGLQLSRTLSGLDYWFIFGTHYLNELEVINISLWLGFHFLNAQWLWASFPCTYCPFVYCLKKCLFLFLFWKQSCCFCCLAFNSILMTFTKFRQTAQGDWKAWRFNIHCVMAGCVLSHSRDISRITIYCYYLFFIAPKSLVSTHTSFKSHVMFLLTPVSLFNVNMNSFKFYFYVNWLIIWELHICKNIYCLYLFSLLLLNPFIPHAPFPNFVLNIYMYIY